MKLERHRLMPDGTVEHSSSKWDTDKAKLFKEKRKGTKSYPGIVHTPQGLKTYFYYASVQSGGRTHYVTWREDEQPRGPKKATGHFASVHKMTVLRKCRDRFYSMLNDKRGYNEDLVKKWKYGLSQRYEDIGSEEDLLAENPK